MSEKPLRLVVFDVDGTLYRQKPLQRQMAKDLLWHYAFRPWKWNDIRIIQKFRTQREDLSDEGVTDIERRQYEGCGASTENVRTLVNRWIYQHPLPYLEPCRFDGLTALFQMLRDRGVTIGIWSDYPATEKLAALGLFGDIIVSAEDVGVLKPNPEGLRLIMDRTGIAANETLMVGDREERDLAAARKLNVDCVIKVNRAVENDYEFEHYSQLQKDLQPRLN